MRDQLVVLHHDTSRDSVINGRAVIGSRSKPQLRRTRSYSDIGGKRRASLMLETEPMGRDRAMSSATEGTGFVPPLAMANAPAIEKAGDDASERYVGVIVLFACVFCSWNVLLTAVDESYSEFVAQIILACVENGLPAPPVEFTNEIRVNVSKKAEKKFVVVRAQESNEQLNSAWGKGKEVSERTQLFVCVCVCVSECVCLYV